MDLHLLVRRRLARKSAFKELGKRLYLYWSALRGLPIPKNIRTGSVFDGHDEKCRRSPRQDRTNR
jgi:hypothetical protein